MLALGAPETQCWRGELKEREKERERERERDFSHITLGARHVVQKHLDDTSSSHWNLPCCQLLETKCLWPPSSTEALVPMQWHLEMGAIRT
jgi:hypothetical protein